MDDDITQRDRSDAVILNKTALMKELSLTAKGAGKAISDAMSKGVVEGKSFEAVLRNMGKALAEFSLKAAFKPLEMSISKLFEQVFQKVQDPVGKIFDGFAAQGPGAPLSITPVPFADGGVIAAPSYFPMGRGAGLMGEAGAEAILPLARGPDGRLGVAASGGAGPSITVNIQATDVDSFRRSEAQVAAALVRAVARGARAT